MSKNQFILMGDVVSSETYNQKLLQKKFATIITQLNKLHQAKILSPLTITLGDEFQGVVKDSKSGVDIILDAQRICIHEGIDFQIRFVLNYGIIETPINHKVAYGMLGRGLSDTRKKIDVLKKKQVRFMISTGNSKTDTAFSDAFVLYQTIIDQWDSATDLLLASEFIKHKDYKIVAKKLNHTSSMTWKREKSLLIKEFFAIEKLINFIAQCH
ncbi:MAG: hypothetical protein A2W93_02915 [Bacteroidetes bacterium GWF2_43_63]|nr:MAG: hypothetical protein A2W94_08915 [Bacteroidetes bacterium GWE2_42_42]OFY53617.1 MAG: hypothetical protein A2W93_02915 [Bacteroidetes bacterium GWF2_43_63]HBG71047.1 hypothetical protein [Bacteroidales bacterium]HCB63625.1 hypothetical protein [Bacteroidales bacterium]HCY24374.1 hypothetical protein [Bacteroidales bacterium]